MVRLVGPDEKLITAVDNPNGSQGDETVHIIAEATGIYRLEVSTLDTSSLPGLYEAKLVELRSATQVDQQRLAARRAFDEGDRLQSQDTADSWPLAIKKYEEVRQIRVSACPRDPWS